jgi:methionyl-tRNA formyltransferase
VSRLAAFSVSPWALGIFREWVEESDHELALLITKPGTASDPDRGSRMAGQVDRDTAVMISPRVTDGASALRDLGVELSVILGFSHVPDAIAGIPAHGTVNLHPALLPDYRGPNGSRALYDGEARFGSTLHRIVEAFDEGPILAQSGCDVPAEITPDSVRAAWRLTMLSVLNDGVPKALGDEPGDPQAESTKIATPFRDEELELDYTLPVRRILAQSTALLLDGKQPRIRIDDAARPMRSLAVLPGLSAPAPGVVQAGSRRAIIGVADAVVEIELGQLPY